MNQILPNLSFLAGTRTLDFKAATFSLYLSLARKLSLSLSFILASETLDVSVSLKSNIILTGASETRLSEREREKIYKVKV